MKRKIIVLVIAFNFLISQTGLAAMITPDGRTDTSVTVNGNVHDVNTNTVSGNTAFNSFSNFDVYSGHTANLHLPQGTANLVNLVHDAKSQINGVLNAYKSGKIGGNVFFLNPNGIMIGAGGVVNVGALTLVTPTKEFMNNVISQDRSVSSALTQAILAGDIPINHSGLISVKGKINASQGAALMAGTVRNEGTVKTNFSAGDVVNTGDADLDNKVMIKDGKIIIAATGDFINEGVISADGENGAKASDIKINAGNNVELKDGSVISASGKDSSNAGNIVIWADNNSYFEKGAAISVFADKGNAGFIELSGKKNVFLSGGLFKASSNKGKAGSILIDPENITVESDFSSDGANYTLQADKNITINDNISIDTKKAGADSGNITMEAATIKIGDEVTLDASSSGDGFLAGDITISAKDNALAPWVKSASAYVDIGKDSKILGKNIKITSEANAKLEYAVTSDADEATIGDSILSVVGTGVDLIDDFALLGAFAKHDINSYVKIGEGAEIKADNDLTIHSKAISELSIMVPFTLLSVVYAANNTSSEISVESGAKLTAGNKLSLLSDVKNYLSASAMALYTGVLPNPTGVGFNGAVAVGNMNSSNKITVNKNAELTSGKEMSIAAVTDKKMDITASASSFNDGQVAGAVVVSLSDVNNTVNVDGKLTATDGDIDIKSSIDSVKNRSVASAGAGDSLVTYYLVSKGLNAGIEKLFNKISDKTLERAKTSDSKFGAAAAVSYAEHTNNASAVIGSDADIRASKKFNLNASVADKVIRQAALASVDSKYDKEKGGHTKENGGSAAVAVAEYNNNVLAYLADGAQVDAGGDISITSIFDLPFDFNWLKIEGVSDITQKLNGNLGMQNGLINSWAMATVSTNEGDSEELGDFGFAASVNVTDYNSSSKAYIGKNANINQRNLYSSAGNVNVNAESDISTINWSGNTGLTFTGSDAKVGLGASIVMIGYDTKNEAYIDDGALIKASGLTVNSKVKKQDITMAVSGGKSESFGFNGTFNWVDSKNNSLAHISTSAKLALTSLLNVNAFDDTQIFNIAGGVSITKNIGIGASVAMTDIVRNTKAYIAKDEEDTAPASENNITATDVNVTAKQEGDIYSYSLAGVIKTDNTDKGKESQGGGGKYGIGVSGDVSINNIESSVASYVNGVNIKADKLNVSAADDSGINTVSGSASVVIGSSDGSSSVGIAGSASVNTISNSIRSFIKNSTVKAKDVSVKAESGADILSIAASGSGAVSAKDGVAVAGSVSINEIDNTVSSYSDNSTITSDEGIKFEAADNSDMIAVAGGVSVSNTVAIGAAVGVNNINNTVTGFAKNSTLEAAGDIVISADNNSSITDVSGSVGIALDKMAAAASVAVNTINNNTYAYADKTKASTSGGNILVSASNKADMLAVAGAVGVAAAAGAGISAAVSTINNNTKAYAENASNLKAKKNVSVEAKSETEVETASAAGAVGGKAGVAGSVAVNNIDTNTDAHISGTNLDVDGSVKVSALSKNDINFYGGMLAVGGKAGVGGTVAVNSISDNAKASVDNAEIIVKGKTSVKNLKNEDVKGLVVESEVKDDIDVWSINGAGGANAGIAGTVTVNDINNSSESLIHNSKVNDTVASSELDSGQSVYVTASNSTDVEVYGGAAAISGNVAVGAVSDTLLIRNKTKAGISGNSIIKSKKDISVTSDSLERYNAILVSGGIGGGTVGVAGNVVVLDIENENIAYTENSTLNGGGNTSIKASDNVEIGKNNGGPDAVAVGAVAGGMNAGVAGSVLVVNVDNDTKALLKDSSVNSGGSVKIEASSKQLTNAILPTLGVALEGAGVAASIAVVNLDSDTQALVEESETGTVKIVSGKATSGSDDAVLVKAVSDSEIQNIMQSLGAGGVGIGAAVTVSKINGKTAASVGSGVEVEALNGKVNVIADNKRVIDDTVVAAGAGAIGLSGSISVANIGSNLSSDDLASTQDSKSTVDQELGRNSQINQEMFGRAGLVDSTADGIKNLKSDTNNIFNTGAIADKGTTASVGANTKIKSKYLDVNAKDTASLKQAVGGVATGMALGVGVSVGYGNINTATKAFIGEKAEIEVFENVSVKAESDIADTDMLAVIGAAGINPQFSAAIGAVVGILNSTNKTEAYIDNNVKIKKAKNVSVTADASSDMHAKTTGVAASGALAVGASVADVNKKGDTLAYIKDNVSVGAANDKAGNVSVNAKTDHSAFAEAQTGAGGIVTGSGTQAKSSVSGQVRSMTGKGNSFYLNDKLALSTDGNAFAKAYTYGVNVGGANIGVTINDANITLDNKTVLGENNIVRAKDVVVAAVQNKAETDVNAKAAAGAVVSGSGADADSKVSGTVSSLVSKNADIQASNDILVKSFSKTKQAVTSDLYNVGAALSVGVNLADVTADVKTTTVLDEGIKMTAKNLINIKAEAENTLFAEAFAGNGGVLAGGGAVVNSVNKSLASVTAGKENMFLANVLEASKITVESVNRAFQDSSVSAVTGSIIGATVLDAENKSDMDAKTEILGNTTVTAGDIKLSAQNKYNKSEYDTNLESSAGGIFDVQVSKSFTAVNANAGVTLGSNSKFNAVKKADGTSSFVTEAFNNVTASDKAKLISGGLTLIPVVESKIVNNSNANITVNASKINTYGEAVFNVKGDGDLNSSTQISVYGVSGIANGKSNAQNNVNNNITFNSGADLLAFGDIKMGLTQPYNGARSVFKSNAHTDIYNRTGVPIDTGSEAKGNLELNNKVDIKNGASLRTAGSVEIDASYAIKESKGLLNIYTAIDAIKLATKSGATSAANNEKSVVNVDGSLLSGVNNIVNITVKNDGTLAAPQYVVSGAGLDNISYEITDESLVNNLVEEIQRYRQLANTYSLSAELKGAYEAEVSRLESELVSLGLIDSNGLVVKASNVKYITFGDIIAGRGDIRINADKLSGTGKLSAPGYAEVKIDNSSNLFLRINDILISDRSHGDILFNSVIVNNTADINKVNKDTSAAFSSVLTSKNDAAPSIDIKNTFTSGGIAPYLEVVGDIENLEGNVKMYSEGSIYAKGNIKANNINIESKKDVVQSYTEGFRHIGGDPSQQWSAVSGASETGAGISVISNDAAKGGQNSIKGNNIFISGRYLNLNGEIQSGVADWTLNINGEPELAGGLTYATALAQYNAAVRANKTDATPLFALKADYGNVAAFFNVLTKQIEVSDIAVQGGRLELYGHILNTGGNYGKLTALDGYGRINITNNSDYNLVVNNVYNDARVAGLIKITDTAFKKGNGAFLVTEYTKNNGTVSMKQTYTDGTAAQGNGSTASAYKPLEKQRYSWATGTSETETEYWKKESNTFWGMDWIAQDDDTYTKTSSGKTTSPLINGTQMFFGSADNNSYSYTRTGPVEVSRIKTRDERWTETHGWWIFAVDQYNHILEYKTGKMTYNTHSVKADYPVSINFIGYETPQTNITSKSSLLLKGSVTSSPGDVLLQSNNGAITNLGNAVVTAKNLTLSAAKDIGDKNLAVTARINNGVLKADSAAGNININIKSIKDSQGNMNDVKVGHIKAAGDVNLASEGSIKNNSSATVIKGKRVELTSGYGGIGDLASFVNVDAEILSAKAQGDINIKTPGSIGVDFVNSLSGDVNLNVVGSVTDANEEKTLDARTAEQLLESWNDLDLFKTDGAGWTKEQLEFAVNSGSLKNTVDTQYQTEALNISGKNVTINATGSIGSDDGFTEINLRNYAALSDADKLLISSAESDNLLFTFEQQGGEDVPVSVKVFKSEDFDVHATGNITLNANGYIYLGGDQDLNINTLTAGSGKNIRIYTKGGINNSAANNVINISGGNLTMEAAGGSIGAANKKLILDITGKIVARSAGGIYLKTANNMLIDSLLAREDAALETSGDILNASGAGLINIKAGGVRLDAANIGSVSQALGIELDQTGSSGTPHAVVANATGDINIAGIGASNVLYVNGIMAGGDVNLSSQSSLTGLAGSKVSGDNISLNSGGNIGADGNKLLVEADGKVTAAAEKGIYMSVTGNSLENVTAKDGNIVVDAEVTNNISNVNTLKGDIILEAKAASVNDIGSGEGDISIDAEVTNNISNVNTLKGDIILEAKAALLNNIGSGEGDILIDAEVSNKISGITAQKGGISIASITPLLENISSNAGKIEIVSQYSGNHTEISNIISKSDNIISAKNGLLISGEAVSKDGKLALTAENSILNNAGVNGIYGKEINLKALTGSIGEENNKLVLNSSLGSGTSVVKAAAYEGIYLSGLDSNLKVATIESLNGDVGLTMALNGSLDVISLPNNEANIIGNNITLLAPQGHIGVNGTPVVAKVHKHRGKINLLAADGIALRSNEFTFFADYVKNTRSGDIALDIPNNDMKIGELVSAGKTNINFRERKKNGLLEISDTQLKKLTLSPLTTKIHSSVLPLMLNSFKDSVPEMVNYMESGWLVH